MAPKRKTRRKPLSRIKWRAIRTAAKTAGRKPTYRVQRVAGALNTGYMETYDRTTRDWVRVYSLMPLALATLGRWLRTNEKTVGLIGIDHDKGLLYFG